MNAVIVGADRLGAIPERLSLHGISVIRHISGRHVTHQRTSAFLPREADVLILLTDFLSHNVMKAFRARAQECGLAVVACRRSASALESELARVQLQGATAGG
ncbi:MAG: DUF2325 domain-containing protein [Verrucomicrobiae bacterium]|nr:DUF2325 domain-containing protein [Verrucomicrobiae bacterium]